MEINRNNYESWFLDYHEGALAPEKVAELFAFLEENPDLRNEFEEFEIIHLSADIPAVSFEEKASLRREEMSDDEIRILMLDVLEGDNVRHPLLMQLIVNKPSLTKEWEELQQTKLIAANVKFGAKNLLHKNPSFPQGYDQLLIASLEGDLSLQDRVKLKEMLSANPSLQQEMTMFSKTKLIAEPVIFAGKEKLKRKEAKVIEFSFTRTLRIAAVVILVIGGWYLLSREAQQPEQVAVIKSSVPVIQNENPSSKPGTQSQSNSSKDHNIQEENTSVVPSEEPALANNSKPVSVRNNSITNHHQPKQPNLNKENSLPGYADDDELAILEMKVAHIPEEEPFVDVQRRKYFGNLPSAQDENLALQTESKLKEVVETATEKVEEVTDKTPLASEYNGTKLTLSSRVIRSLAWVIGKASDNRIQIKTTFNPLTGNLAAYEVETANRKWQKQF